MQGGIDPELPGTAYVDLVAAVKQRVPGMHVHASARWRWSTARHAPGCPSRTSRQDPRAGLGSIPGTAAEILDDEVRWVLTKGKLPTATWIDVVTTAHRVGLRSSSTMMYGHVDHPRHWVGHLRTIAGIQDTATEAGGRGLHRVRAAALRAHLGADLPRGVARPGPTMRDNRAVHAMARILLHGRIDHVQTSWVKLGVEGTRAMLRGGADDLGGTLMEETISRMAGSEHGSAKTVAELADIAEGIGRPLRQRDTVYGPA